METGGMLLSKGNFWRVVAYFRIFTKRVCKKAALDFVYTAVVHVSYALGLEKCFTRLSDLLLRNIWKMFPHLQSQISFSRTRHRIVLLNIS